ncbi:MAG: hypothetical protein IPK79_01770 [Vampirovibrionales bacterium]|nr:hypothetical protein [Vampirovibrionales bacterium]
MSPSVHSAAHAGGPPGLARKGKIPPGIQKNLEKLPDGHPIKALAEALKAKEEEAAKSSSSASTPSGSASSSATVEASVSVSGSTLDTMA